MTSALQTNGTGPATEHEAVADDPATTTYEAPNGLELNNSDPDSESRASAELAGAGATLAETGSAPADFDEVVPESLPDVIIASYPELADSPEVIIGTDDRVRVANTRAYPWSAIVYLQIKSSTGHFYQGTGFLVAPRTIVTAGHCVYMHEDGGWAESITVSPGRDQSLTPFGTFVAPQASLRSVTGWTSSKKRENDYGAIILPANARPGAATGTFGYAVRDDSFLKGSALNLSGYPGDKPGQQWFMAQRTKSVSDRVITYDIDTVGGQSGSPVWVLQNNQRYVVGIHTNGASSGNSATRVVSAVFDRIKAWKAEGQ